MLNFKILFNIGLFTLCIVPWLSADGIEYQLYKTLPFEGDVEIIIDSIIISKEMSNAESFPDINEINVDYIKKLITTGKVVRPEAIFNFYLFYPIAIKGRVIDQKRERDWYYQYSGILNIEWESGIRFYIGDPEQTQVFN